MYVWQRPAVGWSNDAVTCGHDVLLPLVLIVVVIKSSFYHLLSLCMIIANSIRGDWSRWLQAQIDNKGINATSATLAKQANPYTENVLKITSGKMVDSRKVVHSTKYYHGLGRRPNLPFSLFDSVTCMYSSLL